MSFYITTPIYYVNDVPHLGHAYTTAVADAFARFYRRLGDPTFFLTGTDEHGQKIAQAAAAQGVTPIELADQVVARFQALWQRMGVTHNDFIRTSQPRHKRVVQAMWRRMAANGDIQLGTYEGLYCVGCEAYYTEKELDGERCPYGHADVEQRSEESYFFALSNYQDRLLALYDRSGPFAERAVPFVQPEARLNEVRAFVAGGLRDLSISRTSIDWGVPVPGDERHVVYVWLDALSNYISALGGAEGPLYERFWPASVHLIGKDILRFHAVYWPAFLMSAGLPVPQTVLAHGWWTVEGQKMSKSLRNVVDPHFLLDEYGNDVVRYFLLREVPLGSDGDFSHEHVLQRLNADLANDFGNLVSRTAGMLHKFLDGKLPQPASNPLSDGLVRTRANVQNAMASHKPHVALELIWQAIGEANLYVDRQAPWRLAKEGREQAVADVLGALAEALLHITALLEPFMPDTAAHVWETFGVAIASDAPTLAAGDENAMSAALADRRAHPAPIAEATPLFPRLDKAEIEHRLARIHERIEAPPTQADRKTSPPTTTPETPTMIDIKQFQQTTLKVGRVIAAEPVPDADKLLRLEVDLAEAQPRQVVAGLAQFYRPEALVDRRVLVVANLKPAKLRGVESQGMVLAAEDDEGRLHLIEPPPAAPPGAVVR